MVAQAASRETPTIEGFLICISGTSRCLLKHSTSSKSVCLSMHGFLIAPFEFKGSFGGLAFKTYETHTENFKFRDTCLSHP